MRLKSLAIALLCGVVSLAPAFAQTPAATAAKPVAPATAAPPPAATPPAAAATPATAAATPTPAPSAATAAATAPLTNINTASAKDLDKLPLIGKSRAAAIIKNRPYKTTDELVSKKAISQKVFDKIKDKITTS